MERRLAGEHRFEGLDVGHAALALGQVARRRPGLHGLHEAGRLVDADHRAFPPDELAQVEAREAGTAAHVEHPMPGLHAGAFPARVGGVGPEPVLETEAVQLGLVGAEHVLAGRRHGPG